MKIIITVVAFLALWGHLEISWSMLQKECTPSRILLVTWPIIIPGIYMVVSAAMD